MEEHPEKVGEILEELKVKTSETERNIPQNAGVSDAGAQTAEADPSGDPAPASGLLRTFFNDFLSHNPFMDGKRMIFVETRSHRPLQRHDRRGVGSAESAGGRKAGGHGLYRRGYPSAHRLRIPLC